MFSLIKLNINEFWYDIKCGFDFLVHANRYGHFDFNANCLKDIISGLCLKILLRRFVGTELIENLILSVWVKTLSSKISLKILS